MIIPEGEKHWERKRASILLERYLSNLADEGYSFSHEDLDMLCDFDFRKYGGKWDYQGQDGIRKAFSLGYDLIDELVKKEVKTSDDLSDFFKSDDFTGNPDFSFEKLKGFLLTSMIYSRITRLFKPMNLSLSDEFGKIVEYLDNNKGELILTTSPKVDCILEKIYQPDN